MINPTDLLKTIERLKIFAHKDDVVDLVWMARYIENYEALVVMKDNPAIARLVGLFRRENAEIYNKLNTERIMSQEERNYLFAKREANERLIGLLGSDPEKKIIEIQRQLESFQNRIQ